MLTRILKRLRDGIKIGRWDKIWSGGEDPSDGPSNSESGTVSKKRIMGDSSDKGKMNSTVVGTLRPWVSMCGDAVRERRWQQGRRGGNLQGGWI